MAARPVSLEQALRCPTVAHLARAALGWRAALEAKPYCPADMLAAMDDFYLALEELDRERGSDAKNGKR